MAPRFLNRLANKRRPSRIYPKDIPSCDSTLPSSTDKSKTEDEPDITVQRKRKLMTSLNGAVKRVMTGIKRLTTRDVDIPIMHSVTFEPTVEMVATPEQELMYRGLRLDEMFQQFLFQCRDLTPSQAERVTLPNELTLEMASFTRLLYLHMNEGTRVLDVDVRTSDATEALDIKVPEVTAALDMDQTVDQLSNDFKEDLIIESFTESPIEEVVFEPVVEIAIEPTVNVKPTANMDPTVNTRPTANMDPTVNTRPTASIDPVVNVKPTANIDPAVNTKPTANIESTVDTEPTVGSIISLFDNDSMPDVADLLATASSVAIGTLFDDSLKASGSLSSVQETASVTSTGSRRISALIAQYVAFYEGSSRGSSSTLTFSDDE